MEWQLEKHLSRRAVVKPLGLKKASGFKQVQDWLIREVCITYFNTYLFCTSSEKIDHCLLFEKKITISYNKLLSYMWNVLWKDKTHKGSTFLCICTDKWHYHIWDSMAAFYVTRWQTCSPNNRWWTWPLGVRTKRPLKHFDNAEAARLTRWLPLCSHCVLSGTIQAVATPIYPYI